MDGRSVLVARRPSLRSAHALVTQYPASTLLWAHATEFLDSAQE